MKSYPHSVLLRDALNAYLNQQLDRFTLAAMILGIDPEDLRNNISLDARDEEE